MARHGHYIKVPWSILEEEWAQDPRKLARWLRATLEEDIARRGHRRPSVPVSVWRAVLAQFGQRCVYCGASDVALEKDHRMPYSRGGPTDETNIVPACRPCNRAKGTDLPDLWPIVS